MMHGQKNIKLYLLELVKPGYLPLRINSFVNTVIFPL